MSNLNRSLLQKKLATYLTKKMVIVYAETNLVYCTAKDIDEIVDELSDGEIKEFFKRVNPFSRKVNSDCSCCLWCYHVKVRNISCNNCLYLKNYGHCNYAKSRYQQIIKKVKYIINIPEIQRLNSKFFF